MNSTAFSLGLVVLLSLIGVVGDFFIKRTGSGATYFDTRWFVLGFFTYAVTAVGWFFVMKHLKFATLGVWYAIFTMLFLVFVGTVVLHERLNGFEILGIVTAVISLVLMRRFV